MTNSEKSIGATKAGWRRIERSHRGVSSSQPEPSTTRSRPLSKLAPIPTRERRTLDFDIETRRVGFHSGGRFAPDGCEPIAIAWSWVGESDVKCVCLGESELPHMLEYFQFTWEEADIVTGHYIRKFDLPILNGAMMEHGLPSLGPKLTSDTKQDLVTRAGLSASQENLAGMYGLIEDKYHMGDYSWRESSRLTPEGIQETFKRVCDDVRQHKALRAKLIEHGFLRPARMWRP